MQGHNERMEQLQNERDMLAEQLLAMRKALSPYRAIDIANDYAHLVGGECGYTRDLRAYASAAQHGVQPTDTAAAGGGDSDQSSTVANVGG